MIMLIKKERLIKSFCELVSLDSESFQERQVADYIIDKLKNIGFEVFEDDCGSKIGANAGNVYGYWKGTLPGEPILLSAHMDTVKPGKGKGAIIKEDGTIVGNGKAVLGADDISGLASILEALEAVAENKIPHRDIEVLFTVAEEVYIQGSAAFDYSRLKAKEAYVFDLSGPVGNAAFQSPTLVSFEIGIKGRAAHAGFSPELGVHAIMVASKAISQLQMGRIDENTTVNIGTIEGGKARNIVPDSCIVKGEVRSLQHEKAIEVAQKIRRIFQQEGDMAGAQIDYMDSFGCVAYKIDKNEKVVTRFLDICDKLSIKSNLVTTLGGSDNNNFALNGIRGLVLACGMNNVHSLGEYSHVDELVKSSLIALEIIRAQD